MSPWIRYSLLRLALFGGTFTVLMLIDVDWWWAAIVASIVAMTVSYIFFAPLRDAVAHDLHDRRTTASADPDADAEDAPASVD